MLRRGVLVLTLLFVTAAARGDERMESILLLWPSGDYATLRVRLDEALIAYREARDPRLEAQACTPSAGR